MDSNFIHAFAKENNYHFKRDEDCALSYLYKEEVVDGNTRRVYIYYTCYSKPNTNEKVTITDFYLYDFDKIPKDYESKVTKLKEEKELFEGNYNTKTLFYNATTEETKD